MNVLQEIMRYRMVRCMIPLWLFIIPLALSTILDICVEGVHWHFQSGDSHPENSLNKTLALFYCFTKATTCVMGVIRQRRVSCHVRWNHNPTIFYGLLASVWLIKSAPWMGRNNCTTRKPGERQNGNWDSVAICRNNLTPFNWIQRLEIARMLLKKIWNNNP